MKNTDLTYESSLPQESIKAHDVIQSTLWNSWAYRWSKYVGTDRAWW